MQITPPTPVAAAAAKALIATGLLAISGCTDTAPPTGDERSSPRPAEAVVPTLSCNLTPDVVFAGGPGRDGIPALVNPKLVPVGHPETRYLEDYALAAASDSSVPNARVIGFEIDGIPVAIPHNIMWWHEIVNLEVQGRLITVTYCPLTGSTLAFDATAAGTTRFGVSGLIFQNNLIMFDDETGSLWPQMCGRAEYGDRTGERLVHVPTIEMRWEEWRSRHPNSLVVSSETGYDRE